MSLPIITTITALVLVALFFAFKSASLLTALQASEDKRGAELAAFERDRLDALNKLNAAHANHAADLRDVLKMAQDWVEEPHALVADPIPAMRSVIKQCELKTLLHFNRPRF
ncbi:hypothetical protein KYT24_004387 [Salmonella enterica]|nr:hypothetical protein [Salmonella enterica]